MHRILALFQERETRDELGLGAIRDSFSDQFYPGTSTIQTRLRYFFFVPWVYRALEDRRVPSRDVARLARELQVRLTGPLVEAGEKSGIFGRMAGGDLKRLPSEVYWAGLGIWGFRRFEGTPVQYHQALDEVYRRRATLGRKDDGEMPRDDLSVTWHPKLPSAPPSFPDDVDFRLSEEEKEFVKDCLAHRHGDTVLSDLALHPPGGGARLRRTDFPWQHPRFAEFSLANRELLQHAKLFSETLYGAAILYNHCLAAAAGRTELADEYRTDFTEWSISTFDRPTVAAWPLDRFWQLVDGHGHTITYSARRFVEHWLRLVNKSDDLSSLIDHPEARGLIENREKQLKRVRSRFLNRRALDQWSGRSGMVRMSYRWDNVQALLEDLHAGP